MKGLDSKTMGERIPLNDTPAVISSPFHDVDGRSDVVNIFALFGFGVVLMVFV